MLRSLFILMLVALMAAVGFYYENQASESQAGLEPGADNILVAATAVKKVSEPEQAPGVKPGILDHCENDSKTRQAGDICNNSPDEETINPPKH
jgi:hypothetical protein